MAEEKKEPKEKESRGSKRYGHGPKIAPKEKGGDTEKSATPKEVSTGGSPEAEMGGAAPKPSEDAGSEGIPVHERHAGEREAMHSQHGAELRDMHSRHMAEHRSAKGDKEAMHTRHEHERKDMHIRHMGDMRAMHDRHETELASSVTETKEEGKGGTEPGKKAA